MAYTTYDKIEVLLNHTFTTAEQATCNALLNNAAIIIDAYNKNATTDIKALVSSNMVVRAMGNSDVDIPIGATQGSMSALGYSQSWTMGSGSTGELYLTKLDKKLLSVSNRIGSHSPIEDM